MQQLAWSAELLGMITSRHCWRSFTGCDLRVPERIEFKLCAIVPERRWAGLPCWQSVYSEWRTSSHFVFNSVWCYSNSLILFSFIYLLLDAKVHLHKQANGNKYRQTDRQTCKQTCAFLKPNFASNKLRNPNNITYMQNWKPIKSNETTCTAQQCLGCLGRGPSLAEWISE